MTNIDNNQQEVDIHDLAWIMEELDTAGRKLPKDAIIAAQKHRDLIVPELIKAVQEATRDAREGVTSVGQVHFFALFLLTEFQAKEALQAIVEAVSLPGEGPLDLFGDAITSTLARVLICLGADESLLSSMIRNRELNEYVRWEAAQTVDYLIREGRMERAAAVGQLGEHLREAIDNADSEIITPLISVLGSLAPVEAYDEIAEAYQRGMVDTFMVGLEDVDRSIAEGETGVRKHFKHLGPLYIEDTIEELSHWAAFREKPETESKPDLDARLAEIRASVDVLSALDQAKKSEPDMPRVGRNAPCPCGSGKKYKKCCGSPRSRV